MFRNILYNAFSLLGSREVTSFNKDSRQCGLAQIERLKEIIEPNCQTVFGKEHNFASIRTISDFQAAIPINNYDSLSSYIDRAASGEPNILTAESPFMFATTSGTTGSRKFIPITKRYLQEFRRASTTSGYNLLKSYPQISNGIALSIFSPAKEGQTEAGIPFGAISGRLYLNEPKLIRKYISPIPYEVFLIKDYETRYYTILRCALMLPVSCIYTLNPSTIILLAKRLNLHADKLIKDIAHGTLTTNSVVDSQTKDALQPFLRKNFERARSLNELIKAGRFTPKRIWPNLTLLSCWTKAAASFYLDDLCNHFDNVPICDISYGASEGRGTVCLPDGSQALAIRSHFFEFIEESNIDSSENGSLEKLNENAYALTADQLVTGRNYHILFTTSGGLYRYHINDVVKVVGWHNQVPLLEFLHKGGNICSFTGEKVTESQVTTALADSLRTLLIKATFFTVVPQFKPEPHYEVWIECTPEASEENLKKLAEAFDHHLALSNSEYETKRLSHRLSAPRAIPLRSGTYDMLRRHLVLSGVPDAQIKISHLNPKQTVRQVLEQSLAVVHTY